MDNNGWLDKPGVPRNPEEPGYHWVLGCDGENTIVFWHGHGGDTHHENGDLKCLDHWDGFPMWMAQDWTYLGPCLTPTEVDARIAKARKDALEKCISICNAVAHANRIEYPAKWKDRHEGIPYDWQQEWENCAETAEDIAAAILALAKGEADD